MCRLFFTHRHTRSEYADILIHFAAEQFYLKMKSLMIFTLGTKTSDLKLDDLHTTKQFSNHKYNPLIGFITLCVFTTIKQDKLR